MNAVAAAASATDRVVYSWPAANDSGSVWLRTVVSAAWRSLMVVDVANALAITSADSTTPMVRIRPGVVHRNHQRGCAGVVGDRDASGSVDGCANSTVTCARTPSFLSDWCFPAMVPDHFQLYKRILRASSNTRVRILNACVATVTAGWCPTPARPSGVGTVRQVCCCGRRHCPTRAAVGTPAAGSSADVSGRVDRIKKWGIWKRVSRNVFMRFFC